MTLFNKASYVKEAVESVLASDLANFELLVVDDASTDDGPDIVRSMGDPRIRLLSSDRNRGRAASAERGFMAAQGEYIAVLDADDMMASDRLSAQAEFLDLHPDVAVVGSSLQCFDGSHEFMRFPKGGPELRARSFFSVPVSYGACMFRTRIVQQLGVRAVSEWHLPGEDHLFLLALGQYGEFANLGMPLTRYRIGDQNMAYGRDRNSDRSALSKAILEWFGLVPDKAEMEAQMLLYHFVPDRIDPTDVRAAFRWKERLIADIPGRRGMPQEAFHAELARRWGRLFFVLADAHPRAAWEHWRLSRTSWAQLYYLASAFLKARRSHFRNSGHDPV